MTDPAEPSGRTEASGVDVKNAENSGDGIFGGDQTLSGLSPENPEDVGDRREKIRGHVAMVFVWTFAGTVALALLAAALGPWIPNFDGQLMLEMVKTILPPTVAVVGAVTGFYYGTQTK